MSMLGMLAATGRNSMRWPSAKAVRAAGSTDTAAVTAQLEKMKDEPTLFGPRTFTSEIHHQNRGRYLIVDTEAGKPGVVDEWTISNAIPVADLLK
jgi:branched-chain amino acid transport system substrate-binding protein